MAANALDDGGRTLRALSAWAVRVLAGASDSPRLDAELLLAAAAGATRSAVIAHPERAVDAPAAARFRSWIRRRAGGEPLAYLTGKREFHGLELSVTRDVLVPRPETELVVEAVVGLADAHGFDSVLDLGTGSGAIALAVKAERPGLQVTAVDASDAALAVARGNAERLCLEIELLTSDWYSALSGRRFGCIAGNPPYVASGDPHFEGPLGREPRGALDGGADGLAAIRQILAGAAAHLDVRGHLVVEHGFDQRDAVAGLARDSGFETVAALDDLSGLPRALVARRR